MLKLLLLSNGHGEDAIAINIASALQSLAIPALTLAALPLVGEGHGFHSCQIPVVGTVKSLPSGGFNNMDSRQFWRDLQGGLFTLTRAQLMTVKQWAQAGGKILAIGDIVPLAMAWHSGANYAFVGTAKSEYYLRQPSGEWLESTPPWEKWLGSAYYPWECWLMQRRRCYGVFPRDQLTHQILSRKGVQSHNVGNPMMDGLGKDASPNPQNILENSHAPLVLLLLPGSRLPEALENWRLILESFPPLFDQFPNRPLILIAAIAPALALEPFQKALSLHQWQALPKANFLDSTAPSYQYQTHQLILSQHHYADCLQQAHAAIALAGTATEQFVGLGKPVISFPGGGPQYNSLFAKRQTYLLGESLTLVNHPAQVGTTLAEILHNPQKLAAIAKNGRERLGAGGAALRIAQKLKPWLSTNT